MFIVNATNDRCQIFDVNLVANTYSGWYHVEIFESIRTPLHEPVAFCILCKLDLNIAVQGFCLAKTLNDQLMVNHNFNGYLRIYPQRIATLLAVRGPHCREIDQARNSRKVLHQYPCRTKSNLVITALCFQPTNNFVYISSCLVESENPNLNAFSRRIFNEKGSCSIGSIFLNAFNE